MLEVLFDQLVLVLKYFAQILITHFLSNSFPVPSQSFTNSKEQAKQQRSFLVSFLILSDLNSQFGSLFHFQVKAHFTSTINFARKKN